MRRPRSAATGGSGWRPVGEPWWVLPAKLVSRLRPSLVGVVAADTAAAARLPRWASTAMPVGLLLLALAFVSLDVLGGRPYGEREVEWLRFQMDSVYADVPLFLVAACIIGALSPTAGALFVVVFGALDLTVASTDPGELTPLPWAVVGRLVALWALWLLVVEIPVAGRVLARSVRALGRNRFAVAILSAAVTGGLTWAWTLAAPVLLRPLFLWSNLGDPSVAAILPVQTAGAVFAAVAGGVAGVVALLRGPDGIVDLAVGGRTRPAGPEPIARRVVRRLVVAALLTISLGGLVTTPLDAVVLFTAFAGGRSLAEAIAGRVPIGELTRRLPAVLQVALAAALAFGVSIVLVGGLIPTDVASEFFSVVAAVSVAHVLVELAMAGGTARPTRPRLAVAGPAAVAVAGLLLLSFVAPASVAADNCSGFLDCWSVPFFGGLVGGALPLMAALSRRGAPPPPPPPPPPARDPERDRRRREEFADAKRKHYEREMEREQKSPSFPDKPEYQRMRNDFLRKQRDFWNSSDAADGPKSDGKPFSPQAFPSSGAGSKA